MKKEKNMSDSFIERPLSALRLNEQSDKKSLSEVEKKLPD